MSNENINFETLNRTWEFEVLRKKAYKYLNEQQYWYFQIQKVKIKLQKYNIKKLEAFLKLAKLGFEVGQIQI